MKALRIIDAYWFASMPAERLAMLRIITGSFAVTYLLVRSGHLTGYATFPERDFAPVGVASLLSGPAPSWLCYAAFAVAVVSGVAFALGALYRWSAPLFAAAFLFVTTYRNSWGMVYHQDNLVALHLLLLSLAPAQEAWSFDARHQKSPPAAQGRYGWAVRAMCWVTVISYVLAGLAKLKNTGWDWSHGEVLRTHVAYDAVRKLELGGVHSPIGAWLVKFQWPFSVLGVATLVLELGAPLALLHRRIATVWVLGIWGFHLGVILLMAITFAYPVSGCAFASFFAVERIRQHHIFQKFRPLVSRLPSVHPAPEAEALSKLED